MFKIIILVQNMHEIEIDYVNNNYVESKIHKLNRITQERKRSQNIYYENIKIKGIIQIGTLPSFQ